MRRALLLLLALAGCADPSLPTSTAPHRVDDRVGGDRPVADVLEELGRRVGVNLLVDPSVSDRLVPADELERDRPWRDAVESIARRLELDVEERPGGIVVLVERVEARVHLEAAPAREALRLVAAHLGVGLLIHRDVPDAEVSLDVERVHPWRVLVAVARVLDAEVVEESGELVRIVPRTSFAPAPPPGPPPDLAIRVGPPPTRPEREVLAGRLLRLDGSGLLVAVEGADAPRRLEATPAVLAALAATRADERLALLVGPDGVATDLIVRSR